ncbi:MAG TPA: 2-amino-4-hydroxy-6-hydroxymethyldihydropteridine diphosphokinase, partial [Acidimicrobiales bacterium]|nr:2-amino-4-hydroxy-6-hydroxymethyldihydropteridine diphosphokinase [Acidimicrobiales bacterium]
RRPRVGRYPHPQAGSRLGAVRVVVRVYLGLGSNLGDRRSHLVTAVDGLRELDPHLEVSPLYETTPVGGPPGQDDYLNCVVVIDVDLPPLDILRAARRIEQAAGRVRTETNGPRTLDVDILLIGDMTLDEPDLIVPHPRMLERAFVLAPLEDLAPELVPDDWRDLLGGRDNTSTAARPVGTLSDS